jgi:hypothetical protein
MMVSKRLTGSVSLCIGRDAEPQMAVMPAKAGIQYAAALMIEARQLWNTGSPGQAG